MQESMGDFIVEGLVDKINQEGCAVVARVMLEEELGRM